MSANSNKNDDAREKLTGLEDPTSSGRVEQGQKNEPVNFGYENGVSKPEGQRQDGENPDEDGGTKEWQDRARVDLERTSPQESTTVERDFNKEYKTESRVANYNPYF